MTEQVKHKILVVDDDLAFRVVTVALLEDNGFGSILTAIEAMRLGAYDYVAKPCDNDELLIKSRRALDDKEKTRELISLREEVHEIYAFVNIVGRNSRMKDVFRLVQQVA